jgi:large subunit ribosomal protein L3
VGKKMTLGLIGKKCGMTRVMTEEGAIPVTVLEIMPNRITQVKTIENDGYAAIQVTLGSKKVSHLTKPEAGHFARANVEPGECLCEFRLDDSAAASNANAPTLELGAEINVELFAEGQFVDVSGVSKGKGFAGTVKRHNFRTQDATHGNSRAHRAPGSIGQRQTPGRVMKGKKMAGHLGDANCTVLSQRIVKIDKPRHLIMVRGAVPGAPNGYVIIRPAVKKKSA